MNHEEEDARPTKIASHDMQLAVLVSMGFDAIPAEDALERNDWKVSDAIDYLLAAGISMNASVVGDDNNNDDDKSIERRRISNVSAANTQTLTPGATSWSVVRRERPRNESSVRQRVDFVQVPTNTTTTTTRMMRNDEEYMQRRGHPSHQHDRRRTAVPNPPERRTRDQYHLPRHDPMDDRRVDAAYTQQYQQEQQQHHQRLQRQGAAVQEPVSMQAVQREEQELRDYRQQLEPPFPHGLYDLEASEPNPQHLGTVYENDEVSMQRTVPSSRRHEGDEDLSVQALSGNSGERNNAPSSSSPRSSSQDDSTEDRDRRDIRRLYILVLIAIALVIVGTSVAVALVFTIGRNGGGGNSSTTTPVSSPTSASTLAPRPTRAVVTLLPTESTPKTPPPSTTLNTSPTTALPPIRDDEEQAPSLSPTEDDPGR